MNIARTLCVKQLNGISRTISRKIGFTATNYEATNAVQPKIQEEKFDFEDLQVIERTEQRKPKIPPFMKDVFVSVFQRDLLAYPEILDKEETESMEKRAETLDKVFQDKTKSKEERRNVLKSTKMYAAPVNWTRNGLAANQTESIR